MKKTTPTKPAQRFVAPRDPLAKMAEAAQRVCAAEEAAAHRPGRKKVAVQVTVHQKPSDRQHNFDGPPTQEAIWRSMRAAARMRYSNNHKE